ARVLIAEEVAVLNAADAGFEAAGDALRVISVGENVGVSHSGLLDCRLKLGDGELRGVDRVGGRGGAAGGHHLDLGRAATELVAGGLLNLIGAVADDEAGNEAADAVLDRVLVWRPPVAVAAGLRQEGAARQNARPSEEAVRDDLRPRRVEPTGVANGGEALIERLLDGGGHA